MSSVYCGIDETWRWRFKQGDRVYYRWWGQLIQYLGAAHLSGGERRMSLRTDQPAYPRGQSALVTVRADEVPPGEPLTLMVENERGEQSRIPLNLSAGAQGVREARVPLESPGMHKLSVEGHELEASTVVQVDAPQMELQDPAANLDYLERLASRSGGQFAVAADFQEWLDRINVSPASVHEHQDVPLWDSPLLLGLFVVLLAVEWICRRLWQLP
jgi:hypothetical protein